MKPTQNNTAGTEQKTERQFQDGNIVTVKKKNSHGFKVGEKIRIIKLDNVSSLNNVPSYVPIYYAESTTDPRNQWWIAETEIKESKPTTPPPAGTEKEKQSTIAGHTPGDICHEYKNGNGPLIIVFEDSGEGLLVMTPSGKDDAYTERDERDAARIVAAWNEYDQLKAANESLRENNERLREHLEAMIAGVEMAKVEVSAAWGRYNLSDLSAAKTAIQKANQ